MREEVDFRLVVDEDKEFIQCNDDLLRTHREHEYIDYDELVKKKNLSKQEEFEARVIKHILDRERGPN